MLTLMFMTLLMAQEAVVQPQKCVAVQSAGSSMFKNTILYGGIPGALVSKQQYKVVAATNYPAKPGDKFKGTELDLIKANGVSVVLVGKKATKEDIENACPIAAAK